MNPFSLLVKPVGGACNLKCKYCFYREHDAGIMTSEVYDKLLSSYNALPFNEKSIAFQGGEPLLADKQIFEKLNHLPIARSLQTNATLITDELAEMFAANGWLIGTSLDGDEIMNANRDNSFKLAEAGIRRLERAGADYNLLTVVSQANVKRPAELYRYLRDNFKTRYHQYIECTWPREVISGAEWGEFLIGLFDEWIKTDAHTVSIRLFDSIVSQLVNGYPTQCSFSDSCRHYLVVEHDGSVYPCDFFVEPELKLGNIMTHTWEEMLNNPIGLRFAEHKLKCLPPSCMACEFFGICKGDCPRNHQALCAGWKRFYAHALPHFQKLVDLL